VIDTDDARYRSKTGNERVEIGSTSLQRAVLQLPVK
jgi:hypothetical protein